LKQLPITNRTSGGGLSQTSAKAGRVLVCFIAVLLIVMPWTEHFWHFDGLLIGGHDFEFGLLALASICSLVLVLSQQRQPSVTFILAIRHWISSSLQNAATSAGRNRHAQDVAFAFGFYSPLLSSPALRIYNLPIQI
jgi:hypothetical protein